MKLSKISKAIGISALSLGLSLLPLVSSVSAQEAVPTDPTVTTEYEDNDFDWGWLGLLGLIGLAGLAGKKSHHDDTVRYQDPDVSTTRTGFRQ